ncbi:MAG: threonylcarbamoyl-AMP synthase, partial [Clostridiales bacterium]|nr:threonylcarbamoyl-AMP synthase [Clostridiales bacterium]
THKEGEPPRSPGVNSRHDAPNAPIIVVRGDFPRYVAANAEKYYRVGILTYTNGAYPKNCVVKRLGSRPEEYAANLFDCLRALDHEGAEVIFAQDIDCKGINLATNNRLYKAAGYRIAKEAGT